jgi:hypothetical protein
VPVAWLVAVFLFAAAISIYHRSRLHFSRIQFMGRSQLVLGQDRRLVTGGIRRKPGIPSTSLICAA